MFAAEQRACASRLVARARMAFLVLVLASFSAPVSAQSDGTEIWLVTYGPGEIYWQRFGHNAIWVRDADLGLDHTFNFGFFDFEQPGFLWRFVRGRLLYFSAAQPAQSEFAQYINENRSIRAQRLALTPQQALGLADELVREIQPEHRDYLYDYYLNNCSTRVRDALDKALGGLLREEFGSRPAGMNWRDHTRRSSMPDYWLYLGLEVGLGANIDKPISRWDEFFIPSELAEGVGQFGTEPEKPGAGLVAEDVMVFESSAPNPPDAVAAWWPRYLWIPALLLMAAVALSSTALRVSPIALARVWLSVAGMAGVLLVFLWLFTDHEAARINWNLAVFNPLWLVSAVSRRWLLPVGWMVVGMAALALIAPMTPPHQYTADVLAAFLPLNLAASWVMLRAERSR